MTLKRKEVNLLIIVTEKLDASQVANIMDEDGYITVILPVPLDILLHYDNNFFLNYISYQILGDLSLLDIHYTLKGIYEENLLFLIKGNVSFFLDSKLQNNKE